MSSPHITDPTLALDRQSEQAPAGGVLRAGDPAPGGQTPLEVLEAVFRKADDRIPKSVTFPHPGREALAVRFTTEFEYEHKAAWEAESFDPDLPGGFNNVLYAQKVIAGTCTGIEVNGQLLDVGGKPVTFRDPVVHDVVSRLILKGRPVVDEFDCIRGFYKPDPYLLATATAVIRAAGWNVQPPDPTNPAPTPA